MRLPIPWRRRPPAEPERPDEKLPTVEEEFLEDEGTLADEEGDIDITRRRECIYQSFQGRPGPCPRCGGPLQQSLQAYMVATHHGGQAADSFMISSDMGWFCTRCPTVVINTAELKETLGYGLSGWDVGTDALVLGIVDMDAIPEEKDDIPLGDEGNPIPLVPFSNAPIKRVPARSVRRKAKANDHKRKAAARKKDKKKKRRR
jgi:hypothetical protein